MNTVPLSETAAGEEWLATLTEPEFRDKTLAHLFNRMRKAGVIESFQNIHGRNDKGIDYLVAERTPLHRRIVGIQVKSKPITRTGDSTSLSSIEIKRECEAAISHEFHLERDLVRLDNIALWTSARITEDAEKEFLTPGGTLKVQVTKPLDVFSLLERYCHELLAKIPQCALSQYISAKANPDAKAFKLLGVQLNPKTNFLAPQLSKEQANSSLRLKTAKKGLAPAKQRIDVSSLVASDRHLVISGGELSGKTYLLDHLQSLAAERAFLPFLLSPANFEESFKSVYHLLSKQLPSYSPKQLEELAENTRLVILIDDIDKLSIGHQNTLFSLDPKKSLVVGSARKNLNSPIVQHYYIVGVDVASIPKFLRSLDVSGKTVTFTDRAHSFISRSLTSSGLPDNPFTVAMLLAECQVSSTKFSTPTMGRLIERFIEHQLGSHSETKSLVDFETKREFLTRLAGRGTARISMADFRRLIIRHINSRSLPHVADSFIQDLQNDGVFSLDTETQVLTWSHPVIKQFFWTKNLVGKGNLGPVISRLRKEPGLTLAAIVGSQLKNAGEIIAQLLPEISKIKTESKKEIFKDALEMSIGMFPSEADELVMLKRIETIETDPSAHKEAVEETRNRSDEYKITDADRTRLEKAAIPLIQRFVEERSHVTQNLASVVVNARDTRTEDKEKTVQEILRSNIRMGVFLQDFCLLLLENRKNIRRLSAWIRYYTTFSMTDKMLGDPFLQNVFRDLLKGRSTNDESLLLCDLLLGCGNEHYKQLVETLKKIDSVEATSAMYFRIVSLYFFRYHREQDRKSLRKLLSDLRTIHTYVSLPTIAPPR